MFNKLGFDTDSAQPQKKNLSPTYLAFYENAIKPLVKLITYKFKAVCCSSNYPL